MTRHLVSLSTPELDAILAGLAAWKATTTRSHIDRIDLLDIATGDCSHPALVGHDLDQLTLRLTTHDPDFSLVKDLNDALARAPKSGADTVDALHETLHRHNLLDTQQPDDHDDEASTAA